MGVDWGAVAQAFNPNPPRHPAWASPAAFAAACGTRWQPARHLEVIETAVLDAIDTGGTVIIEVPIRHGKSIYCSTWLPAWYLGRNPDQRVIMATSGKRLAERWGRAARGILAEHGPEVFDVSVSKGSSAADRWDIAGHTGGMLSLGVGGPVIGWGGDLIIIDDPYPNFAAAMSPTIRENVTDWYIGSLRSRREPGGAIVVLCARWHEEDLPGFLLANGRNVTEVRMPALCDDPDNDPLGRQLGEPLWPEGGWDADELDDLRHEMSLKYGEAAWLAQGQQRPSTPTGGLFRPDRWELLDGLPVEVELTARWVRGWDLAGTAGSGDWTVGVLIGMIPAESTALAPAGSGGVGGRRPRFVIADVVRGQWDPNEVRAVVKATALRDPAGTVVAVPQDPAQAGKDQAHQYRDMLAGHRLVQRTFQRSMGDKALRAAGLSAQHLDGLVWLVDGEWVPGFIRECTGFPQGSHDDQVDAAAEAFNVAVGEQAVAGEVAEYRDQRLARRRGNR